MRPKLLIVAAVTALTFAGTAQAAPPLPESGFVVFKEMRYASVTEVRAQGTGAVVSTTPATPEAADPTNPCADPSFVFAGPRWKRSEAYEVNLASTPGYLRRFATLIDLVRAHEAWETPFVTDCPRPRGKSKYEAEFGGLTRRNASLVAELALDGVNAVAFQSLAGTVCDGAAACVVLAFERNRILEADLALEEDLTRYGFQDFWTTGDTTEFDELGGRWAIIDTATHEFGHFAGLGHVDESPTLTMYPFVHDGAQTLGLGDMLGVIELY
jgi:matrixin